MNDVSVGKIILGKWRLERCLGQGGMGTVFLAHDLSIDREVALKFLHPSLVALDEYRSRFVREARVMAQVEHPNLVTLYGIEHEGAAPFLVMKFVPGRTLSRIKRAGPMPLVEVMPLVVQMAAALSALHARGFVHRDLKPGNVMVDTDGHVTVLDFGLTRTSEPNLTKPGVTLGSPQYMSPEQVMGATIDGRSDLYTLALVTSELLVGHRPYGGDDGQLSLLQHLEVEPEPAHVGNPAVPEAVSQVLLKGLRKRPADRQPTVAAFVEELIGAARIGPLQLPRRNTAEAILEAMGNYAAEVSPASVTERLPTKATVDDLRAVSAMPTRWTQAVEEPAVEKPLTVAARNLPPVAPSDAPAAPTDVTKAQRKPTVGAPALSAPTPVAQRKPEGAKLTHLTVDGVMVPNVFRLAPSAGTPPPGQPRKASVGAPGLESPPPPKDDSTTTLTPPLTPAPSRPPPTQGEDDGDATDPIRNETPKKVTVDERTPGSSPAQKRAGRALLKTVPVSAWSESDATLPATVSPPARPPAVASEPARTGTLEVVATIVVIVVVLALAWVLW